MITTGPAAVVTRAPLRRCGCCIVIVSPLIDWTYVIGPASPR